MTLFASMPHNPVNYYDRYAKAIKTERIYGERWLRWAYDNPAGRLAVWLVIRRAFFSRWYGRKMKRKNSGWRVLPFIGRYDIDWHEFEKSPFDYKSFNDFFCRALKTGARPIASGEGIAALPADGRHLAIQRIDASGGFYAKGERFDLAKLLGEDSLPEGERPLTRAFEAGSMLISRLCPTDYHRFHFPVDGVPGETREIGGWLYSVNPVALRRNIDYLVRNKRFVTAIESPRFGSVVMVEIGATNVGSVLQAFVPGRPVAKGAEKGLFSYGGSCVITLFGKDRIRFDDDLAQRGAEQMEVYAWMGDRLGSA
ncbi:MAG: archaetidylserine decarboxylase [Opitutaceae bacterium]